MAARKDALTELHDLKADLAFKCKAKEKEISGQIDYITEHIGEIAIKSIIGDRFKKGREKKAEIIDLLVAEDIDTAVTIQKDPHDIKEKLFNAFKKAASGILNLLFR